MATTSTEQRELDLVDKVDFRIVAVANNEDKLQQLLKVYLPALLLKLASEHKSVQTKVSWHPLPMPLSRSPHNSHRFSPTLTLTHRHRLSKYANDLKPSFRLPGTSMSSIFLVMLRAEH
jgi:hypothetical protein